MIVIFLVTPYIQEAECLANAEHMQHALAAALQHAATQTSLSSQATKHAATAATAATQATSKVSGGLVSGSTDLEWEQLRCA